MPIDVERGLPWQNIAAYQRTLNRVDIGLAPLLDDAFNKRKTPVKSLEYGMAGAAVVASPTLYRSVVQGRGTLARTENDWHAAIEAYVTRPELRQRDSKALHEYVVSRLDIHRQTQEIYQTYRNLFKAPGRQKATSQEALRGAQSRI